MKLTSILLLLLCIFAGWFSWWLWEHTGTVHVLWLGHDVIFSTTTVCFILLGGFFGFWAIIQGLLGLFRLPFYLSEKWNRVTHENHMACLLENMSRFFGGETENIQKKLQKIREDKRSALAHHAKALSGYIALKHPATLSAYRETYQALLQSSDTMLLGLRGLCKIYEEEKRYKEALAFAEEAYKHNPKLYWANWSRICLLQKQQEYASAREALQLALKNNIVEKDKTQTMLTLLENVEDGPSKIG